jgi:hypothetical protein
MKLKTLIISSSLLFTACTGKDTIHIGDDKDGTGMECNKLLLATGAIVAGTTATVIADKTLGKSSKTLKLFLSGLGVIMGGAFACILDQDDKENIQNFIQTAKEDESVAWENENRKDKQGNSLRVDLKVLDIQDTKISNSYTDRLIKYQIRSEIERGKFTKEVVTSKLRLKS